jgi:hypothetical protein
MYLIFHVFYSLVETADESACRTCSVKTAEVYCTKQAVNEPAHDDCRPFFSASSFLPLLFCLFSFLFFFHFCSSIFVLVYVHCEFLTSHDHHQAWALNLV